MLDPLLRSFVEAKDEAEADGRLGILVQQHALPLAKTIVGRKLRVYKEDGPGHSDIHDRDDVIADAMVTLVERLHAVRAGKDEPPIQNFVNYTAALIHSAVAHYIRRRHPERARLKDRLRYVFSTEPRLALWTSGEDEAVCGLAEWRGRSSDQAANQTLRRQVERADQRWAAMSRAELAATAVDLVIAAGGPVEFETFVGVTVSAVGVVEPRDIGDPSTLATREPTHDEVIDQRRYLARVWDEIANLPVRQRIALLLNLHNSLGAGLLWLLPIAGVATVRQIAQMLEIPAAEFGAIWHQLPMDDASIGQRLGCTRQQVINLRMAARKRLMHRVEAGASGTVRGRRANLGPVSASLKGNT